MMAAEWRIVEGGLDDPRVQALLAVQHSRSREVRAPGFAFALDLDGLRAPGIRLFTGWEGEQAVGTGALKPLDAGHAEVKSMHTAETARRRGVGTAMLARIVAEARAAGMGRLSRETGTAAYFQPAVAIYLKAGFVPCGPFGDYAASAENRFLALALG